MSNTKKKVLAFSLMIILLISFAGISFARNQGPVWQKGTVTKAAWTEGTKKHIEIDGDTYTFLPDDRVRITRQYKAPGQQSVVEKLPLDRVYPGTEVLIRVRGMEIHQLTVEEP
jgi:hypothetical protein